MHGYCFSPTCQHGLIFVLSSPNNHALAIFQSRFAVSMEICKVSDVSSTLRPPKYRPVSALEVGEVFLASYLRGWLESSA